MLHHEVIAGTKSALSEEIKKKKEEKEHTQNTLARTKFACLKRVHRKQIWNTTTIHRQKRVHHKMVMQAPSLIELRLRYKTKTPLQEPISRHGIGTPYKVLCKHKLFTFATIPAPQKILSGVYTVQRSKWTQHAHKQTWTGGWEGGGRIIYIFLIIIIMKTYKAQIQSKVALSAVQ